MQGVRVKDYPRYLPMPYTVLSSEVEDETEEETIRITVKETEEYLTTPVSAAHYS